MEQKSAAKPQQYHFPTGIKFGRHPALVGWRVEFTLNGIRHRFEADTRTACKNVVKSYRLNAQASYEMAQAKASEHPEVTKAMAATSAETRSLAMQALYLAERAGLRGGPEGWMHV